MGVSVLPSIVISHHGFSPRYFLSVETTVTVRGCWLVTSSNITFFAKEKKLVGNWKRLFCNVLEHAGISKMSSNKNAVNPELYERESLSRARVSWRYMIHLELHSFPLLKKPLDNFNANSRDYRPSCRSANRI